MYKSFGFLLVLVCAVSRHRVDAAPSHIFLLADHLTSGLTYVYGLTLDIVADASEKLGITIPNTIAVDGSPIVLPLKPMKVVNALARVGNGYRIAQEININDASKDVRWMLEEK